MEQTTTQRTCRVVRGDTSFAGKQGLAYFAGISAETAGSTQLCMHIVNIPPGGRAKAHLHEAHETAIYVISGESVMWYGERCEHQVIVGAGDFLFIPAGVPHLPANNSQTEPCVGVLARTDPNEQESVRLRPDLDALAR